MPVVIKELVVSASIDVQALAQSGSATDAPPVPALASVAAQQQLLQDCVAQVLAVLREQAER